jgi:hypothetical protein
VATEKQIAANRANAKLSTGPKTTAGKRRSSGNAFRHGLSGPLPDGVETEVTIHSVARAVLDDADAALVDADEQAQALAFARSQMELQRIRKVRSSMLEALAQTNWDPEDLRRVAALDRYVRVAQTKRRRAVRLLARLMIS